MDNLHKLGALDAGFLYSETDRCPQHVATVQIMELPEGVDADAFVDGLKQFLLERIHLVPYLTNKLQPMPFSLDHPVWVRDRAFCIDNHVYQDEVLAPGGRRQLEQKVAELHNGVMDRNKPLWELYVLTGLEDGHIAYYNRVHHACMDGMAGQTAVGLLMDTAPSAGRTGSSEVTPEGFFARSEETGRAAAFIGALENFAKFQIRQSACWATQMETVARLFQRALDPSKGLGAVAERAPATRFNREVHAKRSYATGEIALCELKALGKPVEGDGLRATVNDLFLALCSGGLRRYLLRLGDLPKRPLIAGCPVSMRLSGDTDMDNKVAMMQVTLATDQADPLERLKRIIYSGRTAKGFMADIAEAFEPNVSFPGMPGMMQAGARLLERSGLFNLVGAPLETLPFNVVVSNVPGPQETLYSNGAKMLTHFPVSIPTHTMGVNITVQSYAGVLYFAVTACARAMPDPEVLVGDMLATFDELKVPQLTNLLVSESQRPHQEPRKAPQAVMESNKAA